MICEVCKKEHDGNYGSGRFCSLSCKQKFCSAYKKTSLKSKQACSIQCDCEYCGEHFESRKALKKHYPQCDKKRHRRSMKWICKCGEIFNSRRAFSMHKKALKHYNYNGGHIRGENLKCCFCGEAHNTLNGLRQHEHFCIKNPDRAHRKVHKHSEEEKKQISERMKKLHAEGKAFSWADLSKRKEPSWPEKWFIEVLKNEFSLIENKDYFREVKFHTFSLDFVFGKKVIEMDGSQHKRSEYQKDCDKRKDALLKQEGYDELRLDWAECYSNSKEVIQRVKNFLEN